MTHDEGLEPPSPSDGPKPFVLAMLLCDFVYRDPWNGKVSILGIFSNVNTTGFPTVLPMLGLYLSLTDGHGKTPITIRIVDVTEHETVLAEARATTEFEDPRVVLEMAMALKDVTFPAEGEYRVQVLAYNELLMERRLTLHGPPTPEKSDEPHDDPPRD